MCVTLATGSSNLTLTLFQGAGPFPSYKEMNAWLNWKLGIAKKHQKAQLSTPEFDETHPLVFTHFDLRPENLILGKDNQLWLIDFGQSGFFPTPFEYVGMYPLWWLVLKNQLLMKLISRVVAGGYARYYQRMYVAIEWVLWRGYMVR